MNINDVIKKPILTEKTYAQMDLGYYTFVVDKRTNKIEIAKAVELIWGVKVAKINVMNISKKPKKMGKYAGFKSGYKKAIVKLAEGTINFFPDEDTPKTAASKKVISKSKDQLSKESKIEDKIKAKLAAKKNLKKEVKVLANKKVTKVTNVVQKRIPVKKNDKKG